MVHLEFCTRGGKTNVEEFRGGGGEATYLRSDCQEEPRKRSFEEAVDVDDDDYDRVYDRISHNSDIT